MLGVGWRVEAERWGWVGMGSGDRREERGKRGEKLQYLILKNLFFI